MIISHCVMPAGGWFYITERGIQLIGETFDLLVANTKAHFHANGFSQENLVQKIEEQIATRNPHLRKEKVLA